MAKCSCAFISYNTFVEGMENGSYEHGDRKVVLLQNPAARRWAARGNEPSVPGDERPEESRRADREEAIVGMYAGLRYVVCADHVVMYVGAGSMREHDYFPFVAGRHSSQVTFVFCDCDESSKRKWLLQKGFASARVVECECGGHDTMKRLFTRFMEEGELP